MNFQDKLLFYRYQPNYLILFSTGINWNNIYPAGKTFFFPSRHASCCFTDVLYHASPWCFSIFFTRHRRFASIVILFSNVSVLFSLQEGDKHLIQGNCREIFWPRHPTKSHASFFAFESLTMWRGDARDNENAKLCSHMELTFFSGAFWSRSSCSLS